eukprot:1142524-Pelagomonas_calceolata.AAC.1
MKQNVLKYHTGTLFNQKRAVRMKMSTVVNSLQCPLCRDSDSKERKEKKRKDYASQVQLRA